MPMPYKLCTNKLFQPASGDGGPLAKSGFVPDLLQPMLDQSVTHPAKIYHPPCRFGKFIKYSVHKYQLILITRIDKWNTIYKIQLTQIVRCLIIFTHIIWIKVISSPPKSTAGRFGYKSLFDSIPWSIRFDSIQRNHHSQFPLSSLYFIYLFLRNFLMNCSIAKLISYRAYVALVYS